MNNNNQTNMTIPEWNERIMNNLLPNIVILFIFIFLAAFGNVLVILVYTFRMRGCSEERYFIPILAVFDLLAATYCGGFMIYQYFHQVTFQNEFTCKTLQFLAGFVTYIPIILLLVISVQRYLRVCQPLKPTMTTAMKRSLVAVSVFVSFAGALPLGFVFDTVPFESLRYNLTGSRCGKIKTGFRLVRAIYSIVLGVLAITVFSSLVFLYFKIGRVVYKNHKKTNKNKINKRERKKNCGSSREVSVETTQNTEYSTDSDTKSTGTENAQFEPSNTETSMPSVNNLNRLGENNRRLTYKLSIIFFIITVIFFMSYVPKALILFVESVKKELWEELSDKERPWVMFVYHLFILNNIVNPFVYMLMDTRFRKEAKTLLEIFP